MSRPVFFYRVGGLHKKVETPFRVEVLVSGVYLVVGVRHPEKQRALVLGKLEYFRLHVLFNTIRHDTTFDSFFARQWSRVAPKIENTVKLMGVMGAKDGRRWDKKKRTHID